MHTARTDHRIRAVGTVVPGDIGTSFRAFHPEGAGIALDAMAEARTDHYEMYDEPAYVDTAVARLAEFYSDSL